MSARSSAPPAPAATDPGLALLEAMATDLAELRGRVGALELRPPGESTAPPQILTVLANGHAELPKAGLSEAEVIALIEGHAPKPSALEWFALEAFTAGVEAAAVAEVPALRAAADLNFLYLFGGVKATVAINGGVKIATLPAGKGLRPAHVGACTVNNLVTSEAGTHYVKVLANGEIVVGANSGMGETFTAQGFTFDAVLRVT